MCIMLYAHWLYGNACMKGEECVPSSWDIFFENFGWMLCWWNAAGVPLVYVATIPAVYLCNNQTDIAPKRCICNDTLPLTCTQISLLAS